MVMEKQNSDPIYDIVIFGASGFTGKYVIREALKFLNLPSSPLKSLSLAGRSPSRVAESLKWAAHPNLPPDIPILTADTSDSLSLRRLAAQTKIILNCVGPFRLYGEPVVAACIDSGCDYLDICGEPDFMERMEAKYHEKAVEKGSLVISACGFDSVPAELGFLFNSRQWVSPAIPNRVEAYINLESDKSIALNFATYESAILGVTHADKLRELRQSRPRRPRPLIVGPPLTKGQFVEHKKNVGLWAVKLPSADSIVVRRTLTTLAGNPTGIAGANETDEQIERRVSFWSSIRPAHFGTKIGTKSLLGIFRIIAVGMIIGLFCKFSVGRWLLLNFPYIFSLGCFKKKGPSEEEVYSACFKMWFVGHGYSDHSNLGSSRGNTKPPDMEIITRVMGPEIGYLSTPIILVQCGLILLNQRESFAKGGVFTPGIIFGHTDLQERLQKNGISFDVISTNPVLT